MRHLRLSILIPTLFQRRVYLDRLLAVLDPQVTDDVQVIVKGDAGEKTIGEKRQDLLVQSQGDYVVYVDDDDLIPDYYVKTILDAVAVDPDCVAINAVITRDGKNPTPMRFRKDHPRWMTLDATGYTKQVNHICPVKRDLALRAGFPSTNFGEDRVYSQLLYPLLRSEVVVEPVLYYYQYRSRVSTCNSHLNALLEHEEIT